PGGVHVVDSLDPVVLLQRHRVEAAHLADAGERGFQAGEDLYSGAGPDVLVPVEHDHAVAVPYRDHGAGEVAVRPGLRGAGLRLRGVPVHILAAETLDRGDQVRTDSLRNEPGGEV